MRFGGLGSAAAAAALALACGSPHAATWLGDVSIVSDVTAVDADAGAVRPRAALMRRFQRPPAVESFELPDGVRIAAFERLGDSVVFSVDVDASLPGGLVVSPRDMVSRSATGEMTVRRGADFGLTPPAKISALATASNGDILFSVDAATHIGSAVVRPGDVLRLIGDQVALEHPAEEILGISSAIVAMTRLSSGSFLFVMSGSDSVPVAGLLPGDAAEWRPGGGWRSASVRTKRLCPACRIASLSAEAPLGLAFRSGLEQFED